MKKLLIASSVAVLAFASVAAAATFNSNLTVGSTGTEVTALQTALIAGGYNIPAIAAGTAKGYFGSQTKSAVMAYQSAHGVPSTGFVGPLTRAALNGGAVATTPAGWTCPVGMVCTPVGTTPVVSNPGTITTLGVAGNLAFSLQSTPSNGTSVDKGQSADVARYKLQAGASDMAISSLSLDFDNRFWLYASGITIKDDSGAVLAQKTGLTANDFTELTVGSSYRIYVPLSYVVPKAGIRYFTVNVSLLPVTDRSAATLSVTQAQVRSVDGTGVTDTQTDTADRSFSYTGSNNGQVILTVNSSSPLKRLVQVSTSAETNDVVLGVLDVKSQNKDGSLRSLSLTVRTTGASGGGGPAASTIFNDIKIKVGSNVYSADSVGSTTAFTNIQPPIFLAKDQYVSITILAKVAKDTSNMFDGVSASTTLTASGTNGGTSNNPVVEDSTYNTVAVNSGTFVTSDAIFSASSATLSNMSATATSVGNSSSTGYNIAFAFTVTAGDNTLFVPKSLVGASAMISTSTTGSISARLVTLQANPDTISGDDTAGAGTEYVVPAGSSRMFTISGSATGSSGNSGSVKITNFKYGTASGNYSQNINYNLGVLQTSNLLIP